MDDRRGHIRAADEQRLQLEEERMVVTARLSQLDAGDAPVREFADPDDMAAAADAERAVRHVA